MNTGKLAYDGPLYDDILGPSPSISSMCQMYKTDFAYDGPIFLVPSSLSSAGSPVPTWQG